MNLAYLFTEEGRTRFKNAYGRFLSYAFAWLVGGLCASYPIYAYYIRPDFTPLQQVYLKDYLKSAFWGSLSNRSESKYRLLVRVTTDPRTKREVPSVCTDPDEPSASEAKRYYWRTFKGNDASMYEWFRWNFYDDHTVRQVMSPAVLGGLFIFLLGTAASFATDHYANKRYLRGKTIRGTRELTPQKYVREQRAAGGLGLKVYQQRRK